MLLQVVFDADLRVNGRVDPALDHLLDRIRQRINAGDFRAVFFRDPGIDAGDRVGGFLSLQVIHCFDLFIVILDNQHAGSIEVRGGEIVFFRPFRCVADTIAGNVEPAGFHTGQNGIPRRFIEPGLDTKILCNRLADFNIVSDQRVALIMIGIGRPVPLRRDGDIPPFLNLGQAVCIFSEGNAENGHQDQGQQNSQLLFHRVSPSFFRFSHCFRGADSSCERPHHTLQT